MRPATIMQNVLRDRWRRLSIWLRGVAQRIDARYGASSRVRSMGREGAPLGSGLSLRKPAAIDPSIILRFPIRGEALLVKLARLLRARFGERGPADNPFLFTISRDPVCRLTIDRSAFVEFRDKDGPAFHLSVEPAPDTTVSLQTGDFDVVVNFIVQYIEEKLRDVELCGAAS